MLTPPLSQDQTYQNVLTQQEASGPCLGVSQWAPSKHPGNSKGLWSALVLLLGDHTHMASAHMVFGGWDAFLLSLAGRAVGRAWFPSWLSIRIPIWGSPPLQLPINTSAVINARLEAEGTQTKPASQLPGIGNNPTSRDSEAHSLPEETSGSSGEWE